jgi:hypothetical protein
VFEHMHYRTGKGDYDEIYRKRRRFGDDDTFLRMRDERDAAARQLLTAIEGNTARRESAAPAPTPARLLNVTLLDRGLPLSWRLRLYLWFLARNLARRVFGGRRRESAPGSSS